MLKAKNIQFSYKNKIDSVDILQGVSLEVNKGDFVCITGKSGSGKTTLLNILSGLLKPSHGEVYLLEKSIYTLKDADRSQLRREEMGSVFQFFNLFNELTVKENILVPLKITSKELDEEYLSRLISILELSALLDRYPYALSGGQQQRVAIARALIHKPSIIFADEPTGNLDEQTAHEVIDLLLSLQKELNQTLVLVTHDKSIAQRSKKHIHLVNGLIDHTE